MASDPQWQIFDSEIAKNKPSRWANSNVSASPHLSHLVQTSDVSIIKGIASWILTKGKRIQDGEFHFSVRFTNKSYLFRGVFRQIDPTNHQALEIDAKNKRISLIKVAEGFKKELLGRRMELNPRVWYRVSVQLHLQHIKVIFREERKADRPGKPKLAQLEESQKMKPLFETQDNAFVQGSIGFGCSDCSGMGLDALWLMH